MGVVVLLGAVADNTGVVVADRGRIGDLRLGDFSLGSRRGSAPNLLLLGGGGEMRLSCCCLGCCCCLFVVGGEIWAGVQLLLRLSPGEVDSTSCANLQMRRK
jgi:hypothetical protein